MLTWLICHFGSNEVIQDPEIRSGTRKLLGPMVMGGSAERTELARKACLAMQAVGLVNLVPRHA